MTYQILSAPTRAFTIASALVAFNAAPLCAMAGDIAVSLTGAEEVPAVVTPAEGAGKFSIAADGTVSGSVSTTTIEGTAAHIHEGAAGKNGGVLITLSKKGSVWSVPPNSKLTDPQRKALEAGNLYVNVHSAAHQDGEIRGQLKP